MFLTRTFSPARKDTVFDSFIVLGGWKKVLLSIEIFLFSQPDPGPGESSGLCFLASAAKETFFILFLLERDQASTFEKWFDFLKELLRGNLPNPLFGGAAYPPLPGLGSNLDTSFSVSSSGIATLR